MGGCGRPPQTGASQAWPLASGIEKLVRRETAWVPSGLAEADSLPAGPAVRV